MRLPDRVVVDTGFVIRGLGQRPDEPRSELCRTTWARLLEAGTVILVPTPVIAEVARFENPLTIPRTRQIVPVPFDVDAADRLAQFGELTYPTSKEKGYWKYDAMIAAIAATCFARALISIDGDYAAAALTMVLAGLPVHEPEHYEDPQGRLVVPGGMVI